MNPMPYVLAAYIATWAIHGVYLAILGRRYARAKKAMGSLRK